MPSRIELISIHFHFFLGASCWEAASWENFCQLFALVLPRSLVAMADVFFGMVNLDLLLLLQ
jgi:hypothetical protein